MTKKALIMCGPSQTVITFRLGLIEALKKKGYDVAVVALDDKYGKDVLGLGIEFYSVDAQNRSLNPFGMRKLQKKYRSLVKIIRPDVVFTFMLKPNIFGVRAAKKEGVNKIFSTVEGAGDVFINDGLKWKIIRFVTCRLYRGAFKKSSTVFFLNDDDKNEFVSRGLVNESKCEVIPGVGVDTEYFSYKPIKNYRTFLMIARMLKTKGVIEYCRAARVVKKMHPDVVFNYLGAEGTLKLADIQEYVDDGSVNYLGTTKDVRPYLEGCSVMVLPSYREGMPMSVMEAEAVGRAIIATDVQGCRHAVDDGVNGYLVKEKSVDRLVEKMLYFINNPEAVDEMSKNSRAVAVDKFDKIKVNEQVLSLAGL